MDPATPTTVCRACGTTLGAQGGGMGQLCLGCLLEPAVVGNAPPPDDLPIMPATASKDVLGSRFAHYEIATGADGAPAELGRGAMGITYRAFDTTLRCAVALKVVALDITRSSSTRARFLREARAAAGLRHPHVASVFYFAERPEDGQPFYAMELVEGETLHARVRRAGGLPVADVVEIGAQTTDALAAAEARGLTHRDLKPANLMLVAGETINVKMIDFGLAKSAADEANLTLEQDFIGTPAFASPEHFNVWQDIDARSDFYTLGVTLWYALTGSTPFAGRTLAEIHDRQIHGDLPLHQLRAANVPPPVVELLCSLLSPDPAGRPQTAGELAAALAHCKEHLPGRSPGARRRTAAVVVGFLLLLTAGTVWVASAHRRPATAAFPDRDLAPAKSIAVLPFENLSDEKANGFFTDGVQDEILTDLSKVADLKVISRSSVMQYKDASRNLREIGKTLDVAYIVEGSVQRAGNKIRVTAELIDARNNTHKWAEHYDRDLADVFAIQSEIAQAIAGQLQASISPQTHAAMEEAPTHDLKAYEIYLRATEVWRNTSGGDPRAWIDRVVGLLAEAIQRDPDFARAYALLAEVHAVAYGEFDRTPARAALVRNAVETVARLRPGSVDAHEAMGTYEIMVENDFARAHDELGQTVRLAPNNANAFHLLATADRFQALWDDSIAHYRKALELDPEDESAPLDYIETLEGLRRYPDALAALDHLMAVHPRDVALPMVVQSYKAQILLDWKADPRGALAALNTLPTAYDPSGRVTGRRIFMDQCARDFAAADRVLAACSLPEIAGEPSALYSGYNAWYRGDKPAAEKAFTAARPLLAAKVSAAPDDDERLMRLATLDAALGRKADALSEARRAAAMHPLDRDTWLGPISAGDLAVVLAWTGEHEEAIRLVETLCAHPNGPGYGYLHLHPDWDALRGDPRFEAAVASLAPKP